MAPPWSAPSSPQPVCCAASTRSGGSGSSARAPALPCDVVLCTAAQMASQMYSATALWAVGWSQGAIVLVPSLIWRRGGCLPPSPSYATVLHYTRVMSFEMQLFSAPGFTEPTHTMAVLQRWLSCWGA